MTRLFKRSVKLIAGALAVDGLRTQFKARKTLSKEPNELEATVYNLSESSRASLQAKGIRIILEAGYGTETSVVFSGDARLIEHSRDSADWVTKIQCGDGERAYRYTQVQESFGPGTPLSAVFRRLAETSGLDIRAALAEVGRSTIQLTQGFVASGKVSTAIERLLKGTGMNWSIQDGRLQVLSGNAATTDAIVLVSPDTGLVGSPAHGSPATQGKPQVLKIKSLLHPGIRPGGRVRLEGNLKGDFKILEVTHTGDTHGGEWYSEMEAVPV